MCWERLRERSRTSARFRPSAEPARSRTQTCGFWWNQGTCNEEGPLPRPLFVQHPGSPQPCWSLPGSGRDNVESRKCDGAANGTSTPGTVAPTGRCSLASACNAFRCGSLPGSLPATSPTVAAIATVASSPIERLNALPVCISSEPVACDVIELSVKYVNRSRSKTSSSTLLIQGNSLTSQKPGLLELVWESLLREVTALCDRNPAVSRGCAWM